MLMLLVLRPHSEKPCIDQRPAKCRLHIGWGLYQMGPNTKRVLDLKNVCLSNYEASLKCHKRDTVTML